MTDFYERDVRKRKNKIVGNSGEIKAVNFLMEKGYEILQTNFKTKFGEIDIIAEKGDVIVFVEVKNRSTFAFGRPIEAVTYRKQQTIKRVAEVFLGINNIPFHDMRFDVIEVSEDDIIHTENAFD